MGKENVKICSLQIFWFGSMKATGLLKPILGYEVGDYGCVFWFPCILTNFALLFYGV